MSIWSHLPHASIGQKLIVRTRQDSDVFAPNTRAGEPSASSVCGGCAPWTWPDFCTLLPSSAANVVLLTHSSWCALYKLTVEEEVHGLPFCMGHVDLTFLLATTRVVRQTVTWIRVQSYTTEEPGEPGSIREVLDWICQATDKRTRTAIHNQGCR